MLKVLLTISLAMVLGVVLLELRQQHLELNYQTNKLHNEIRKSQAKLWNQQLQIAVYTAPNAISKTVGEQKVKMVAEMPMTSKNVHWIDPAQNPDAE